MPAPKLAPVLTPRKPSLMSGPALILIPLLLADPGHDNGMSISRALLLQQVHYWCKKTCIKDEQGEPIISYTYEHWQDQLPFLSTRWLKHLFSSLEAGEWIKVERGGSYNNYKMSAETKDPKYANLFSTNLIGDCDNPIKVFPSLAVEIGLVAAIILQTLHLRTYKNADWWVKKTVREWHDDMLPFVGVRTLERAFSTLDERGAVVAEKVTNRGRNSKRLRVNYVGLAQALSLAIDGDEPPRVHAPTAISSPVSANTSPMTAKSSPSPAISSPLA